MSLLKTFLPQSLRVFSVLCNDNQSDAFSENFLKILKFWIIDIKGKVGMPGGEPLVSAYCPCSTGLFGPCNRDGDMLFGIEAAILQGLTHPSCPIILTKWNIPKLKTKAEGVKLKESVFTKPNHKKATHDQERSCRA